jgi:TonB family protein
MTPWQRRGVLFSTGVAPMGSGLVDGLPRWAILASGSAALHILLAALAGVWWTDPATRLMTPSRTISLLLLEPPTVVAADVGFQGERGGRAGTGSVSRASDGARVAPSPPASEIVERLAAKAARAVEGDGDLSFGVPGSGGGAGGTGIGTGSGEGAGDGGGGAPILEFVPWPKVPSSGGGAARTIKVRVLVSPSGKVRSAELEAGQVLDAFATEALAVARRARFQPARRGTRSSDLWVSLPITFHPR